MTDPATQQWREAMQRSTGAELRHALETCDRLHAENERLTRQIALLHAEIQKLSAKPRPRRPGLWRLTDKARAALAASPKEPS
jgi:anti-sigma factor RsiW